MPKLKKLHNKPVAQPRPAVNTVTEQNAGTDTDVDAFAYRSIECAPLLSNTMVIVLEGPDGAGKSTLAQQLVDNWTQQGPQYTGEVVHVGPPREPKSYETLAQHRKHCLMDLIRELGTDMTQAADRNPYTRHLLVFDRLHIGAPVYGALFRPQYDMDGYGDLGSTYFNTFTRILNHIGAMTYLVMPPVETVVERSIGRDDEYLDEVEGAKDRAQQLRDIYDRYFEVMNQQINLPEVHRVYHSINTVRKNPPLEYSVFHLKNGFVGSLDDYVNLGVVTNAPYDNFAQFAANVHNKHVVIGDNSDGSTNTVPILHSSMVTSMLAKTSQIKSLAALNRGNMLRTDISDHSDWSDISLRLTMWALNQQFESIHEYHLETRSDKEN